MTKKLAVLAGVIVLILANLIIFNREKLIRNGRIVLLELAPVDPRSLMQGDYMALRFDIENEINLENGDMESDDGYVLLEIDDNNIGSFISIYNGETLTEKRIKIRYRIRKSDIKFATNAYFFQEGDGALFEDARYGEFRVTRGTAILIGLIDENFNKLGRREY